MGTITYRFSEVRQTDSGMVACPDCGKKRRITVSRSYYRNGFHIESETREKNARALSEEICKLMDSGKLCSACEDARDGFPIMKKQPDGSWNISSRETGELLGVVLHTGSGRCKYEAPGLCYCGHYKAYFSSVRDAAAEYVNPTGGYALRKHLDYPGQTTSGGGRMFSPAKPAGGLPGPTKVQPAGGAE